MKITNHNYEAYVLDYLEGNLSEEMANAFCLFLENHPAIAEEINALEDSILPMEILTLDSKDLLKKNEEEEYTKIDLLLAKKLEGQLDPEEDELVEKLLKNDAQVGQSWDVFQKTILSSEVKSFPSFSNLKFPNTVDYSNEDNLMIGKHEGDLQGKLLTKAEKLIATNPDSAAMLGKTYLHPNEQIIFPNKEKLKQTVVIPLWKMMLPVVAIAAMMVIGIFIFQDHSTTEARSIATYQGNTVNRSIIALTTKQIENAKTETLQPESAAPNQASKSKSVYPGTQPSINPLANAHKDRTNVKDGRKIKVPSPLPRVTYNTIAYNELDHPAITQRIYEVAPTESMENYANNEVLPINNNYYQSFRNYAKETVKKTLWGDEATYPDENYTAALIEKTVQKVDVLDQSLPEVSKDDHGWAIRFKKFSVQRKKS